MKCPFSVIVLLNIENLGCLIYLLMKPWTPLIVNIIIKFVDWKKESHQKSTVFHVILIVASDSPV
jgi:hypothetical protein